MSADDERPEGEPPEVGGPETPAAAEARPPRHVTPPAPDSSGAEPATPGEAGTIAPESTTAPPAAAAATATSPAPASPPAPALPAPPMVDVDGEPIVLVPRARLRAQSRRDFLLFTAAAVATAAGAWWLLPQERRMTLAPRALREPLDALLSRVGLTPRASERALDRAMRFDDDVAEALYSRDRRVRTYARSDVTPLRNNYNGRTPGPEYLAGWVLELSGLASGRIERLTAADVAQRFPARDQITRLVCVEGWSAIAWWGGFRFADLIAAFPPVPDARWASLRSAVNLDANGRPDPYYVSIDLDTARHEQALLATHKDGAPLGVDHGAPMRLVVPMKLGLKNIKAITAIEYSAHEPRDYWNERGYSKYDGL